MLFVLPTAGPNSGASVGLHPIQLTTTAINSTGSALAIGDVVVFGFTGGSGTTIIPGVDTAIWNTLELATATNIALGATTVATDLTIAGVCTTAGADGTAVEVCYFGRTRAKVKIDSGSTAVKGNLVLVAGSVALDATIDVGNDRQLFVAKALEVAAVGPTGTVIKVFLHNQFLGISGSGLAT